ncbi:hypothetical protein IDX03_29890, partial [Pseudomonas aeruginosa]
MPEKVQLFINEIDAKVKKELTVAGVKAAIQTTKNINGAAAVVLFGIMLLTNPAIMVVLRPLFLAADVIGLFKDFSANKVKYTSNYLLRSIFDSAKSILFVT